MDLPFFFLDFDGVVCDSLPECFISSRRAYHEHLKGESLPPATAREKELFHRYRPFIRNGEDYLLLHDLIARGVEVHVQEDLDREIASRGRETMDRYGRLFYRAREEFLREDREFWLELNPLFPGMGEILEKVLGHPKFYILSTKKAEFILEILAHHRIPWREDRVIFSGPRPKGEVIRDLLSREGVMGRQDYAALGRVAAGYDRLAAEMAKVPYKNSVPPILRQMASGHRSLLLRYEKLWNGLADGMEKKNGIIADRERSLESYTQALEYFLKMSRENGFIIDPRDPEKIVVFMDKIRIIPDGTLGLVFRRDDEYIGRVRFRDQQDRLVASLVDLVDTGNQMKPFDIILVQEQ